MDFPSYSPRDSPKWNPIPVRSLRPAYPPFQRLLPTPLPDPLPSSAESASIEGYDRSVHVVPASYLRHSPHVEPPVIPQSATKEERAQHTGQVFENLLQLRKDAWAGKLGVGCEKVLWNSLHRYTRKNRADTSSPGVTLFFAHANGFPKEIWKTTLKHLLSLPTAEVIDEIWVWESIQHGDTALMNAGKESALFDWADNTNDILSFFLYYLPSEVASTLPTHLNLVSSAETRQRRSAGFSHRKLVAVGHSYGGCTSLLAALMNPVLFSSLILVDPVVVRPGSYETPLAEGGWRLLKGAIQRRDTWTSREEAYQAFKRGPFGVWDDAVLRDYVNYGTWETIDTDGNKAVKLKMSGIQEAVLFADNLTSQELYQEIEKLDESIELRWIMPGVTGPQSIGGPDGAQFLVWRRPKNSSNTRIVGAGHLIAQEKPRELAHEIASFLQQKYGKLRAAL